MAKALEINAKHVADAIRRLAENSERELESIVAYGAKQMAKKAQRIFKRAEYDGVNDVVVSAYKTATDKKAKFTYAISAHSPSGSVAFIEFGAGTHYNSAEHPFRQTSVPPMAELGYYGVDKPQNTFNPNWFGSRGQDDWWVYKSDYYPEKPTPNWGIVGYKSANPRYGYYWTRGNRPARAMWGAKLEFDKKLPEWIVSVGGKTK